MRRFLKFFIFLFFFSSIHTFSRALDMYVFDVGVANFVMLVKDRKALVVDCGIAPNCLRQNTFQCKMIEQILDDHYVTEARVVLTHDDKDHKQGVLGLLEIFFRRKMQFRCPFFHVIGSGLESLVTDGINDLNFCYCRNSSAANFTFVRRLIEYELDEHMNHVEGISIKKIQYVLQDCLGDRVYVCPFMHDDTISDFCLLPSKDWANEGIVFFIEFAGKRILLPGDANGNLLAYCLSTFLNFGDWLANTNIMVLPHHGSIQNGEQHWTDVVLKQNAYSKHLIVSGKKCGRGSSSLVKNTHYIDKISQRLGLAGTPPMSMPRLLFTEDAMGGYIRFHVSNIGVITASRGNYNVTNYQLSEMPLSVY